MNEIGFRNWLSNNGKNKKVISDTISRLKKIEHEFGFIDIETEYKNDRCYHLLSLFDNTGCNERMAEYKTSLPIGKYYISAYKYALKLYISYIESFSKS